MPDLTLSLQEALGLAREKFDQGNFSETESICRQVLAIFPDNFGAIQLLGIALAKQGRKLDALEAMDQTIALKPASPESHFNKAMLLDELGRTENALVSANAALEINPDYFEALQQKGNLLRKLNRIDEAASTFEAALVVRPADYRTTLQLLDTYTALGLHKEALALATSTANHHPDSRAAHYNLGNALFALNRNEEAIAAFDKAISLAPHFANAHYNRGNALKNLNRLDEALASYDRAIAANPDHGEAFNNRGCLLIELGRARDALTDFDRAVALKPDPGSALTGKGVALFEAGHPELAVDEYNRAIAINQKSVEAHYNKGSALDALKQFGDAIACYNRAIEYDNNYVSAHWNLALDLLRLGDFAQGWREYEWRKKKTNWIQHDLTGPEWQGEIDPGKTLLLYGEQGLGDTIQFARLAIMIAEQGMKVILLCQGPLLHLLRGKPHPNLTIEHVLPGLSYDTHAPLMSVPFLAGIHPPDVPSANPSYLAADESLVRIWQKRLPASGLRIGVVWQGNPKGKVDAGRSYPLRALSRIAAMPSVTLVSMQKNHGLEQLENLPANFNIMSVGDFDNGPGAFLDTAAIMMNLDLVITSDTSIAHLAGALGRPVWVALKHVPDWRWELEGETSPWYPTMRLFRQKAPGDWDSVVSEFEIHLKKILGETREQVKSHHVDKEKNISFTTIGERSFNFADSIQQAKAEFDVGNMQNAAKICQRLIDRDSQDFDAHHLLSASLAGEGLLKEAINAIENALILRPGSEEALNNKGAMLADLSEPTEALKCYDRAIAIRPDFAEAICNKGIVLNKLGALQEALACFDKALSLRSDYAEAYNNKGITFLNMMKMEDALACFESAIALRSNFFAAILNKALTMKHLERPKEALDQYNLALKIQPDNFELKRVMALLQLLTENFKDGWKNYELRRKHESWKQHTFESPEWNGEFICGSSILVFAEQGLGDTLQFARFAFMLAEKGMKVVFRSPPQLKAILESRFHKNLTVVDNFEGLSYNVQCPLMSIPWKLELGPKSFLVTRPDYIAASPALVKEWRKKLPFKGLRVGIVWQGNPDVTVDKDRSIPLIHFAPLARMKDVTLVSLQKNHGLDQLKNLPSDFKILTLGDFDNGPDAFLDTAAIMMNLDLVITSDTSIAHLAGALGRPVWVALQRVPEWRWGLEGETSPWYPTMRLFRQKTSGEWDSVIKDMETALNQLIQGRQQPAGTALAPVAFGELIDKITILEIKSERIADPRKNANVRTELDMLTTALAQFGSLPGEFANLKSDLRTINETLWDIEDHIRDCERDKDFGPRFIELARSVYMTNDRRALTKRKLNELVGSIIVEEKSYSDYK